MTEWRSIETAPKDGEVFLSYWDDTPVFVAWSNGIPARTKTIKRLFRTSIEKVIREGDPAGFRVVSWSPRLGWGLCGNCAPFTPSAWMPLPEPFGAGQ